MTFRYRDSLIEHFLFVQVEENADVSILHITSVSHRDAGEVKCRAYLPEQEATRTPAKYIFCRAELKVISSDVVNQSDCREGALLDVIEPRLKLASDSAKIMSDNRKAAAAAVLIKGPQDTVALVGDRVLLKATYLGYPEPNVRWTRAVSVFYLYFHLF